MTIMQQEPAAAEPRSKMLELYLHTCAIRADGTKDCFLTRRVEWKSKPMYHHEHGLMWTASGYGARVPTEYMIKVDGRWRRVYCRIYSNNGTLFIGKKHDGSAVVTEYGA